MPTGGQLTIRTANVRLDDKRVSNHPPLPSGPYVMVAVTDTGDGIDAETKPHLFEPFFTTKEQGKGTGMGLASAFGIIKQSGGFIEVESEIGRGSTFSFYLPSAGTPHRAPVTAATTPTGSTEPTLPQTMSERASRP
jgi:signal transduction histidine kinase